MDVGNSPHRKEAFKLLKLLYKLQLITVNRVKTIDLIEWENIWCFNDVLPNPEDRKELNKLLTALSGADPVLSINFTDI